MSTPVQKVAPPALPLASDLYSRQYQDQLNNVHRLFYTRLMQSYNGLLDVNGGGKSLSFPYMAASRNSDFNFATANTATLITMDSADFASGMTLDGADGIHVEQDGIYNYQYSVQFANTHNQAHNAWLWLRDQNGDIAGTGSKFSVPSTHGSSDGYLLAACNFYLQLSAGDYVELWGAASQVENGVTDGVYCEYYAASVSPFAMPSIPSVVATLTFVSNV